MEKTVIDGVIIGGAGGALAGITVYTIQFIHNGILNTIDRKRIYNWLKENTSDSQGNKFRSTRAIASWNNLTEDRVRYICSTEKKIFLSTGRAEDMWGVHTREANDGNTGELVNL